MKTIKLKSLMVSLVAYLLIVGAGCTPSQLASQNDVEQKEESTVNQEKTISILDDITGLSSIVIYGEEKVELHYQQQEWMSEDLSEVDQQSVNTFLTNVLSLRGAPIKEISEELKEGFQQPVLSIEMSGQADERALIHLSNNGDDWFVQREDTQTIYNASSLPSDMKHFSPSLLEPSIPLAVKNISEIKVDHTDGIQFQLSKQSNMNKVKASSFVSGWFLHGLYETDFSIEYTNMESLLNSLTNLKGTKTEAGVKSPKMTVELSSNDTKDSLKIGEKSEEGQSYPVEVESNQTVYEVPTHFIDPFTSHPLSLVDNFIALLPLSAVQEITIERKGHEPIHVTADHQLIEEEDQAPSIHSEFFVNNEKMEEDIFRKTYQYLAALSYDKELTDETEIDGSDIWIRYRYLNEGNEEMEEIHLIPSTNEELYIVDKNNIREFSIEKEEVQLMLDQFESMIN